MKFTQTEADDLKKIEQKIVLFLKKNKRAAYRKIRNELLNLSLNTSLENKMKWSNYKIKKLKIAAGAYKQTIVKKGGRQKLLKWLKDREKSVFTQKTTTAQVRKKWNEIFYKVPSPTALQEFRRRHKISIVKDEKTGKICIWKV